MGKRAGGQAEWERRQRERELRWRKHVRAWRASGLTQAEYCRRSNLTPADFSWWKHELRRRDGAQPEASPEVATFIPVKLGAASEACDCEVVLPNGRRLRIGQGVSATRAAELVAALEGPAPC